MPYGTDTYGLEAYGSEGPAPAQTIDFDGYSIASEEVVGTPNVGFVLDFAGNSIASAEAVGSPQINLNIAPDTIASGEVVGAPSMQFVVAPTTVPSQESVGAPELQFIVRPDSIASAEAFGEPEITTNFIPGWTVRVYRLDGTVVAELGRWQKCRWQDVLSGKGVGQTDILWEDAVELNMLGDEFVWRVFYDGKLAFSWLTQAVNEQLVTEDQRVLAVFSGPGLAEVLEWGTVLPPEYPVWTNRTWTWADVRAMKVWRDLFFAAQDRGALPMVLPSFSDAADTDGAAWTDQVTMEVEPGGTLFQYMEKLAGIADADWRMAPSWSLDVRKDYGRHLEEQVRFQLGADQVKLNRGHDRRELRNVGYVEGGEGGIQEAYDAGSATKWGRREVYMQAGDAKDISTVQSIAQRLVDQSKDERVQILCSVLPDGSGRKVYHDYQLGDWVGLDGTLQGNWRAISISVDVDDVGSAKVELGLQSLFEYREAKLERLQANGGGSTVAPGSLQSGLGPSGVINAVTSSPAPNPPTGLSLGTGANESRVYIDVSWTAVAPSGPDPVVAYEAELSRAGVGVVTAQRTVNAPVRFEPVEPGISYDVRVRAISRFGRSSTFLGPQSIIAAVDTTIPAQATGLSVGAGVRTLTATWDENAEIDVKDGKGSYDLQIDTANTFATPNLRGKRVGGTIASFADLASVTTYYARVRAVDSSGNVGPWSTTQSSTTGTVGNTDIASGAVDTLKIADGAITTAKIGDAQITTAKVQELSASKLSAGTITAALITLGSGGVFRAGRALAPYHYMLLDESGLRFYKDGSSPFSGGTLTLEANVSSGNFSIVGNITATNLVTTGTGTIGGTLDVTGTLTMSGSGLIRTAPSGERLELSRTLLSGLAFYSGSGNEEQPSKMSASFGTRSTITMISGAATGSADSRGVVVARSAPTSGGWGHVELSAYNDALSGHTSCDLHLYMGASGVHRWYGSGDAEKAYMDANGNLRGSNWASTSDSYRAVWGHRAAADWTFEFAAIYQSDNGGDKGTYVSSYENGWVQLKSGFNPLFQVKWGGEWRVMTWDLPVLGGMDMIGRVANSFMQIGRATSSGEYKEDITSAADLVDVERNPIYELEVKRYKYRRDVVKNADDINKHYSAGMVGMIAEEVAAIIPQAVNWWRDDDGSRVRPTSLDHNALMSYVIAGLQAERKRTTQLEAAIAELTARLGKTKEG